MVKPSIDVGTSDIPDTHTFTSATRKSDVSPQALSERWGISISTAIKTLNKSTQKFLRSGILPLSRRYRMDRVFHRKTLAGVWSTDTMDGRSVSLDGNKYAQVFTNKNYFARIYPMDSKGKAGDALRLFCQEFGVPEKLTVDGSKEQTGKNTQFMKQVRKHDINYHIIEPDSPNQNPCEHTIGELRRKWFRLMIRKHIPEQLWDYGMSWVAETMCLTYTSAGKLTGCIPMAEVTGEGVDISEYLDFSFYDQVWYKDNGGLSPPKPGRWLGVASRTGKLMTYHILQDNGKVLARSTVQRVTNLEKKTADVRSIFQDFDKRIHDRLKTKNRSYNGCKPNPEDWADLLEEDEDFRAEFRRVFNNMDIPHADDLSQAVDVEEDHYIHMEMPMHRTDDGPTMAKVTKRLRDADGIPIGTANDNPILDSRLYEIEHMDGLISHVTANTIAENLFSQVDDEGNRHVLIDSIIDSRTDGNEITSDNSFILSPNGGKRRRKTTKGWEILIQWKDGSSTWEAMKDVKDCYPVQLAEYAQANNLTNQPAFVWWIPQVLKKKKRIISKIQSKYWLRTHKFGIEIPKSVKHAKEIDDRNGNSLWMDAIYQEMKNVRIAFERFDGTMKELSAYEKIDTHMIFDVKMGENFRRKARLVADGHKTSSPSAMTYSSVVSRDSVRICLTLAALNGLKVLSCDIQNAYLTAPNKEKVYTFAGPEFGAESGQLMIVTRALYGLRTAGASFRSFFADKFRDMGFLPSTADPDVWMRPSIRPATNGEDFLYWEYILAYVDDVLCISHDPDKIMNNIREDFTLTNDKAETPDTYLGGCLSLMSNEDGQNCWAISSDTYCAALVDNLEMELKKTGQRLPSKCYSPIKGKYQPDQDGTCELSAEGVKRYQEIIGSLRWAIELGRVDILLETALLSKYVASPRMGHLEQAYHIIGYLKQNKKLRLMFDCSQPPISNKLFKQHDWYDFYGNVKESIPDNMPEPRGNDVAINCFEDANHAGDASNRRSQTGVLIFINRVPIHWFSEQQSTVEASTFGAEFNAMKASVKMIEALRYKLRMFGVPLTGPANIFCDNQTVYSNTVAPESTLKKRHHSISYHRCREAVAASIIRITKQGTEKNLADIFTKILPPDRRRFLLERFTY